MNLEERKRSLAGVVAALKTAGNRPESEQREVLARCKRQLEALTESGGGVPRIDDDTDDDPDGEVNGLAARVRRKALTDADRRLHELNDKSLILSQVCRVPVERTKYWREAAPEIRSMDTTNGSFGPWVPTEMSASLHEQVRLQLVVAGLFERVDMPSNPYVLPIGGSLPKARLIPQQGDADADLDVAKRIATGMTSPGATALTLNATKVGARLTLSEEATEDVVFPVLNYVYRAVIRAMAEQEEDGIVNGDTTATHMDADVTDSDDGRKQFKGLRKHCPSSAKFANGASDKTKIRLLDLRKQREKMGVYGVSPTRLAYVVSPMGALRMLSVEDPMSATNPSPVVTLDKLGSQATILNGMLGSIDGIPIITSPFVREDLDENGVKLSSGTADRSLILCVNRDAFVAGDRRSIRLVPTYIPVTDQTLITVLRRYDFKNWFAGDPVCSVLTDVKK